MPAMTPARILGDPELVSDLQALLESEGLAEVTSKSFEENSEGLDFDIIMVATVVALISNLFFSDAIVPSLYKLFRRHRGSSVVIETPTRTVTFISDDELTEEQLRGLLLSLRN